MYCGFQAEASGERRRKREKEESPERQLPDFFYRRRVPFQTITCFHLHFLTFLHFCHKLFFCHCFISLISFVFYTKYSCKGLNEQSAVFQEKINQFYINSYGEDCFILRLTIKHISHRSSETKVIKCN